MNQGRPREGRSSGRLKMKFGTECIKHLKAGGVGQGGSWHRSPISVGVRSCSGDGFERSSALLTRGDLSASADGR